MEFHIVCATWIRDADEKVIDALKAFEKMPDIQTLAEITGLLPYRIEGTLRLLRQQEGMYRSRKRLAAWLDGKTDT